MSGEIVRIDEETKSHIDQLAEESRKTKKEVATEVVETGLKELQGPVSAHIREMALNAAYYFTLIGIVLLVIGLLPGTISSGQGVRYAITMVTVAMIPVATIECSRVVSGQSDMGWDFSGGRDE